MSTARRDTEETDGTVGDGGATPGRSDHGEMVVESLPFVAPLVTTWVTTLDRRVVGVGAHALSLVSTVSTGLQRVDPQPRRC